jgi:hypothetical protein
MDKLITKVQINLIILVYEKSDQFNLHETNKLFLSLKKITFQYFI